MEAMEAMVAEIARCLVAHPEQVEVERLQGDSRLVIALQGAEEDVGPGIGPGGRDGSARGRIRAWTAGGARHRRLVAAGGGPAPDDGLLVVVARLGGAHGLHGELRAQPTGPTLAVLPIGSSMLATLPGGQRRN